MFISLDASLPDLTADFGTLLKTTNRWLKLSERELGFCVDSWDYVTSQMFQEGGSHVDMLRDKLDSDNSELLISFQCYTMSDSHWMMQCVSTKEDVM